MSVFDWESQLRMSVNSADWCNDNTCGTCRAATACVVVIVLLHRYWRYGADGREP